MKLKPKMVRSCMRGWYGRNDKTNEKAWRVMHRDYRKVKHAR